MHPRSVIVFSFVLCSSIVLECCGTPAAKKYPPELVHTYAELLVLHEKGKIAGNTPDSLYTIKVKGLFAARKINEEEFQRRIVDLSHDDVAWRGFLNDATVAMDSIRAAKPLQ
jgi:hypothetical protein